MRILIVRPGALGDTIVAEPLVRSCRQAAGPGGEVVFMGTMPQAGMIGADVVIDVGALNLGGLFDPSCEVDADLAGTLSGFDLAMSFWGGGCAEFAESLKKLGCRRSIGLTAFPEEGGGVHVVDHCLEGARAAGIPEVSAAPAIAARGEWREGARELLSDAGVKEAAFVAVHPGSGSAAKCWPAEKFAEVARGCECRSGVRAVMISGPADGAPAAAFREAYGEGLAAVTMPSLNHLAGALSLARGFIGNDSGVTHLAAALGTRTVAVFVSTDSAIWGPRGDGACAIEAHGGEGDVAAVTDAAAAIIGEGCQAGSSGGVS